MFPGGRGAGAFFRVSVANWLTELAGDGVLTAVRQGTKMKQ